MSFPAIRHCSFRVSLRFFRLRYWQNYDGAIGTSITQFPVKAICLVYLILLSFQLLWYVFYDILSCLLCCLLFFILFCYLLLYFLYFFFVVFPFFVSVLLYHLFSICLMLYFHFDGMRRNWGNVLVEKPVPPVGPASTVTRTVAPN